MATDTTSNVYSEIASFEIIRGWALLYNAFEKFP
jgi:hypothetical protein